METPIPDMSQRFGELLAATRLEDLDELLESLHPADIADAVEGLDTEKQVAILKRLDTETAADVLAVIDEHSGQALLLLLSDQEIVNLIEEMPSDDATDVLQNLPREKTERLEALMETEDRTELRELRAFGEETAGGLMQVERIAVPSFSTMQDAIDIVRQGAEEVEDLQKVFVVDERGRLLGFFNILDLITTDPATPVVDVMETAVAKIPVDMDQEHVAAMFRKYDEFTLPVVDKKGRLVGRVTVDDIIDVMEDEASEDFAHIAGTTEDELGETSVFKISRTRLPWLVNSLVGQLVAALIMSRYETSLQQLVLLTFFVPLVVGTAGSIGIQAAVVVVREMAIGEIDLLRAGRRVLREMQVGLLNGMVLGGIVFVAVGLWQHDYALGGMLWTALMLVILVAALIGASVPLLFERWRIDPAIATGPFITVCNDVIGLSIYLSIATAYLAHAR